MSDLTEAIKDRYRTYNQYGLIPEVLHNEVQTLLEELDLLERKLELAIVQRNLAFVYDYTKEEKDTHLTAWNKQLEELK